MTKKGKSGIEEIQRMMVDFRANPPKELAGSPVVKVIDYNEPEKTGLPKSNVLQFFSQDGCKVTVRPSAATVMRVFMGISSVPGCSDLPSPSKVRLKHPLSPAPSLSERLNTTKALRSQLPLREPKMASQFCAVFWVISTSATTRVDDLWM